MGYFKKRKEARVKAFLERAERITWAISDENPEQQAKITALSVGIDSHSGLIEHIEFTAKLSSGLTKQGVLYFGNDFFCEAKYAQPEEVLYYIANYLDRTNCLPDANVEDIMKRIQEVLLLDYVGPVKFRRK